jgi:1,2-diacylglycerol 3-alpha-glucosyltransferase
LVMVGKYMKSGKHILLITPGFPKDENDFICIPPMQEFLINFKSRFPLSKFKVITLHYPYQEKKYYWNGIPIISLAGENKSITKPLLWYKCIRRAKKINKSEPFSFIHSLWLGECTLLGNVLSNKLGCPHICTLMGQDVNRSNKYLRFLKNNHIKIVALSKNQSDQYNKLTNKNVDEIIHWGINDQPNNIVERDIDLLAVGSLIPLKNYSLLIKLVEEITATNKELNCILVGSGPEESKLKQMVVEKGVENNIEFTGQLSRTDIFKLMQRSKIFVHPSKFEGSGFVFAEALVNGMNIVSFNVGYAQSNPKWFIGKNEEDFINITKNLLTSNLDFSKINHFPITETVNKYSLLYGMQ